MENKKVFLQVEHLKKYFNAGGKARLKAVDDVSLDIYEGETLALVGESGCGKSTLGRTIMGIYKPTEGRISYEGYDMSGFKGKDRKDFAKLSQMIFQDPYSALNPRKTVGDIVAEGIDIHKMLKGEERQKRIYELLALVGLNENQANRYPHEFSGGQRQRIGIARALAMNPKFIVCDEPISALDVSIQAQIVNLLRHLQKEMNLTYLFIAHDLNMVRYIGDRIAVMYLGNLVEIGPAEEVYHNPRHPYTEMLISSVPVADPEIQYHKEIKKDNCELPSPINPPKGCVFCTRCEKAMEICHKERPQLVQTEEGHKAACHLIQA